MRLLNLGRFVERAAVSDCQRWMPQNNQIKALPRMEMPLLETLILDRNGFSAVPRTVYETLTCISRLSLIDNPIVRLVGRERARERDPCDGIR